MRLLDFGGARRFGDEATPLDSSSRHITPAYASPQSVAGDPPAVTDDIFIYGKLSSS
ncbi:MAG: hypothetical protein U5K74_13050 [Gemmatimonadaceae bacterium]|nr:hypothetical protein [Gemmatimonadaceae bacterium]